MKSTTTERPATYDNKPLTQHAMWPGGEPRNIRTAYDNQQAQQGGKAGAK